MEKGVTLTIWNAFTSSSMLSHSKEYLMRKLNEQKVKNNWDFSEFEIQFCVQLLFTICLFFTSTISSFKMQLLVTVYIHIYVSVIILNMRMIFLKINFYFLLCCNLIVSCLVIAFILSTLRSAIVNFTSTWLDVAGKRVFLGVFFSVFLGVWIEPKQEEGWICSFLSWDALLPSAQP